MSSPQDALAAALHGAYTGGAPLDQRYYQQAAAAILAYPFTPDQRRVLAAHFLDAETLAAALPGVMDQETTDAIYEPGTSSGRWPLEPASSEVTPMPSTEAGKRLLAGLPWRDRSEEQAWGRLIDAIEAEARATPLAELEAGVEELLARAGYAEHEPFCVPARECTCRHLLYVAVLDFIRKAGER